MIKTQTGRIIIDSTLIKRHYPLFFVDKFKYTVHSFGDGFIYLLKVESNVVFLALMSFLQIFITKDKSAFLLLLLMLMYYITHLILETFIR